MNVNKINSRNAVFVHGNWLFAILFVLAAATIILRTHEDERASEAETTLTVVDQGQNPDKEHNSLRSEHHDNRDDAVKRATLQWQVSDGIEEDSGGGPQSRAPNRLPRQEKPVDSDGSDRNRRSYYETSPQQLEGDSSDADHHIMEFLNHLLSMCEKHATICASHSSEPLPGQSSIGHGRDDSSGDCPPRPVQPDAGVMDGQAADAQHTDRERRQRSSDNHGNLTEVGAPDGDAHRRHGGHAHRPSPETVTIEMIRRAIRAFRSSIIMEQRLSRQSTGSDGDFAQRENPGRIGNSPRGDGRLVHDPQGPRRQ